MKKLLNGVQDGNQVAQLHAFLILAAATLITLAVLNSLHVINFVHIIGLKAQRYGSL